LIVENVDRLIFKRSKFRPENNWFSASGHVVNNLLPCCPKSHNDRVCLRMINTLVQTVFHNDVFVRYFIVLLSGVIDSSYIMVWYYAI